MKRWVVLLVASGLVACQADDDNKNSNDYNATIRWTEHGIPHILADDIESAMFGQGYAFAELEGCILADQIVRVRSQRSRYLGPGEDGENLDSDFAVLAAGVYARAEETLPIQSTELQGMIAGYAAGFNAYVQEHQDDMECRGEAWLGPVTPVDLWAHYLDLAQLGSGRNFADFVATAQPPPAALEPKRSIADLAKMTGASNGWAIGSERSANGQGMVVANPHFPWEGELRLYESHVTVPDVVDVYGVSLMGVPGVLIGFNENVAWTHTFSFGQRFTMYKLELDPNDPTVYYYDGQPEAMESTTYDIEVLEGGELTTRSRTMYRSRWGPILNVVPFGWTREFTLTARDANADNDRLIAQFSAMNRAQDLQEFQEVHRDVAGIPWVNTMAADPGGTAWYIDSCPTPNLSRAAIDDWLELSSGGDPVITLIRAEGGFVALPAGAAYEWVEEAGSRSPGLVPIGKVPQLERRDFVFNANDSHWLTNPAEPLVGYSELHGFERTDRRPRTRMNAILLTETGEASYAGADNKFDLQELQNAIFGNRALLGELLRDQVVERCRSASGPVDSVDLAEACDVLAGWDLHVNVDSRGAALWREFLGEFGAAATRDRGTLFEVPFDPDEPLQTPHTLAAAIDPADDRVLQALAAAVLRLQQAGVALDVPLGEVQYALRGSGRVPIHGGTRLEGITNLMVYDTSLNTALFGTRSDRGELIGDNTGLTADGYHVNYGSSFVMTMRFTDDGPEAEAVLTYGQSDDPTSPYYTDQTELFSNRQWRRILFTDADIMASPDLREADVDAPRE